jgi:hypothetical protein
MVVILKTLGTKNILELFCKYIFKVFWIFPLLCKFENKIVCILLADWKNNRLVYICEPLLFSCRDTASYGKNHLQNLKGPMELAPGLLKEMLSFLE